MYYVIPLRKNQATGVTLLNCEQLTKDCEPFVSNRSRPSAFQVCRRGVRQRSSCSHCYLLHFLVARRPSTSRSNKLLWQRGHCIHKSQMFFTSTGLVCWFQVALVCEDSLTLAHQRTCRLWQQNFCRKSCRWPVPLGCLVAASWLPCFLFLLLWTQFGNLNAASGEGLSYFYMVAVDSLEICWWRLYETVLR